MPSKIGGSCHVDRDDPGPGVRNLITQHQMIDVACRKANFDCALHALPTLVDRRPMFAVPPAFEVILSQDMSFYFVSNPPAVLKRSCTMAFLASGGTLNL